MPKKSKKKISEMPRPTNNNLVKSLLILVILLIILDAVSLYFYYKPDLFSSSNNYSSDGPNCKDGTPYDECAKEKPYFCYQGELLKSAFSCGCPEGYEVNFQDCVKV